jgi:cation diffusion facilitator CzcD-associated flavoprotein CzcO
VNTQGSAPRILIIGAGMSGLLMAIKLRAAGISDFRICEKAADLGGTWRENTYPGIGCDVAAHYYTYQGVPNPDWSTRLPKGPEIQAYLQQVTEQQDLHRHITFNKEAVDAQHDGTQWTIHFRDGESVAADFLVACCGLLHHPRYPDIPGLKDFEGPVFHSARWNHDVNLEGKRIGLIGNGSTGAQIIARLSEQQLQLKVFQRTPQWIFPLPDRRYTGIE